MRARVLQTDNLATRGVAQHKPGESWEVGKGLSYKCRAVCLHPCGPKLALQVSDYFTHRHGLQHDLLTRAVLMRGGRWNIIRPGQDAKSTYKVKRIQHLKDVDDLVDVVDDILDPI